jgi:hypothetical protein
VITVNSSVLFARVFGVSVEFTVITSVLLHVPFAPKILNLKINKMAAYPFTVGDH